MVQELGRRNLRVGGQCIVGEILDFGTWLESKVLGS